MFGYSAGSIANRRGGVLAIAEGRKRTTRNLADCGGHSGPRQDNVRRIPLRRAGGHDSRYARPRVAEHDGPLPQFGADGRVKSVLEILIKLEHGPCLRDAKLTCVSEAVPLARTDLVQRAFRLEWLTIGWMTIEALVAVGSGIAARSVTLLAFGLDSVIELASAGVLIWRLTVEMKHDQDFSEAAEERASKLAAALLFGLAIYVVVSAGWSLWHRQGADFSLPGFLVAIVAIPAVYALSRAKIRVADALGSRALRADAAEAITCGYLSVAVVIGLIAQILFRAWWVDGVTSLAIMYFLLKEGREAWQGDDCCE
jgi:hypothetical protein